MGNNMTIEEMIAAGVPWDKIKARINQLQKEQKEKERMKAAEAAIQAQKAQEVVIARDRFVNAFIDWLIIEDAITEAERAEFTPLIVETCDNLAMELRQIVMFTKLFNKIK